MPPSEPSAHRSRSVLWISTGVLLIVASLGADSFGLGGRKGLGQELPFLLLGVTLVASQVWAGTRRVGIGQCLVVWLTMGLVCGFADAILWTCRGQFFGMVVHKPKEYLWLMPAMSTVLFVVPGVLCGVAARILPRMFTLPVLVLLSAIMALWSVTRQFDWLDHSAAFLIAVGFGTALGRVAAAHPDRMLKVCRRSGYALVGLAVVTAIAISVRTSMLERKAVESLPAPPAGAPNVLLIVLDTLRADHFGSYGYERPTTPNIDLLAEDGVVFDQAYATAPWTLTSHVSMFTGRYPHEVTADWNDALDDSDATLAEVLGAHGYATGAFVGNLFYTGAENGIDRGFQRYEDYFLGPGVFITTPSLGHNLVRTVAGKPAFTVLRNGAGEVTDRFLAWLSEQEAEDKRPFFAFLNYFDAHAFYDPPEGFEFGPRGKFLLQFHQRPWGHWSPKQQQGFVDAYDGCIAFIDDQIKRLVGELRSRDQLDNTVIILTSDHGELFGEHGLADHANSLYHPLLRMPLIVRWPAKIPGRKRVSELVSQVDLPATVLDLVGIKPDTPMPGHSLVPLWNDGSGPVELSPALSEVSKGVRTGPQVPVSKGDMKSLVLDGMHFIRNGDGSEELYDLTADPDELTNLIDSSADAARLRAALARALGQ